MLVVSVPDSCPSFAQVFLSIPYFLIQRCNVADRLQRRADAPSRAVVRRQSNNLVGRGVIIAWSRALNKGSGKIAGARLHAPQRVRALLRANCFARGVAQRRAVAQSGALCCAAARRHWLCED